MQKLNKRNVEKEKRLNGIAMKRSLNLFNPKTLLNIIDLKSCEKVGRLLKNFYFFCYKSNPAMQAVKLVAIAPPIIAFVANLAISFFLSGAIPPIPPS